ncbi:hypothetical protein H4R20_000165 [Coemansia guatemalensis]|uniref:Uncharacterized protein n=1 Tax=Coemansia guatemalensis TaxID=2761395 RepID=A0A9W8LW46_9FUNG|nr:hypothetical protein H4R20_000165 [Coemansia guatemalensis]
MESAFPQRAPVKALSVAGFKRFPTVDQVAKALNANTYISDSDLALRRDLIQVLGQMIANSGQLSTVLGTTAPLYTLRLTSAMRKLSFRERDGRPMKTSRARALLKTDPGSLSNIVLGLQRIEYPFEVTLRPDNTPMRQNQTGFAWVVVECNPEITMRIMSAISQMDQCVPLPKFDDIRTEAYFGEGDRLAQLNAEIAAYNEKWKPDHASTYAVFRAQSILHNVANQLVPTKEVKLEIFGSRLYEVCKSTSDFDFSMTIDLSDIGPESAIYRAIIGWGL